MKKINAILVLLAVVGMVFTSCKKDDETDPVDVSPSINFKGGGEYISQDATVTVGETFVIGINANSNASSGKNLKSVSFTVTSDNQIIAQGDSTFNESSYNVDYYFTLDNAGEAVILFQVTDKNEEKSSISLTITAEPGTTALGEATDLYWERVGGTPATGLDGFGLKWENNLKVTSAVIEKDLATKFVQLTADAWTSFTTVEELTAAVDAAEDMEDYRGISVEANGTYDEVLGVIYEGEYYMIHLTSAEIETGSTGTTVKIYGASKK